MRTKLLKRDLLAQLGIAFKNKRIFALTLSLTANSWSILAHIETNASAIAVQKSDYVLIEEGFVENLFLECHSFWGGLPTGYRLTRTIISIYDLPKAVFNAAILAVSLPPRRRRFVSNV
ncbi:hypothetical protein PY364_23270 [Kamptonema sp. UHCC 0994]|nr:hypothetical protein [Kamptonema sp. UHCC 0994]